MAILTAAILALPPQIMSTLGIMSDYLSDMSPEYVREFEHIVFTMLLN